MAHLALYVLLGVAAGAFAKEPHKPKGLLMARRGPDDDHFVDEIHDNARVTEGKDYMKPGNALEKDFAALDTNGDKELDLSELMFRQYSSGCEPIEAEVRANDYIRCGDTNHDDVVSLQEFNASASPQWAECIKDSELRRAHGLVKFFQSDQNYDDKLSATELSVGLIKLWGPPGAELSEPLLGCADKNKDGFMDQDEFHKSIFAYNPATRTWQMWSGTSDPSILECLKGAFTKFDAALVFHASDRNKDGKLNKQELYDIAESTNPGITIDVTTLDAIITAADKDKNGSLNLEEFAAAGEAYKGPNEANFHLQGRDKWPNDTYNEGYGMSVNCHDNEGQEWRVYSEDLGRVQVTPTDDQGAVKVTQR